MSRHTFFNRIKDVILKALPAHESQMPDNLPRMPSQPPETEVVVEEPALQKIKAQLKQTSKISEEITKEQLNFEAKTYQLEAMQQNAQFRRDIVGIIYMNKLTKEQHLSESSMILNVPQIIVKIKAIQATKGRYSLSNIPGILRATVIINSQDDVEPVITSFEKKGYRIWEHNIFNLFESEKPGFKECLIRVHRGEGDNLIKEVSLITEEMYQAKNYFGYSPSDLEEDVLARFNLLSQDEDIKLRDKFLSAIKSNMEMFYEDNGKVEPTADDASTGADGTPDNSSFKNNPPNPANPKKSNSISFSDLFPNLGIRSLRESLKAIWQPISAKFSSSSEEKPNSDELAIAIERILSSIVTPVKDDHKSLTKSISQDNIFMQIKKSHLTTKPPKRRNKLISRLADNIREHETEV
ncbi:MAG: hypothetical protein LCH52_08275 [Bacteroidetes bacterium]|nr:hypothetical protein [Bacteroidota bacterium]